PTPRPATTHVVPPAAGMPSGQRSRSAPPHAPATTSASTGPPESGAGSPNRTIAARAPAAPAVQRPSHVAARSRSAAAPQSSPATPITPTAAPSGAWRASPAAPTKTARPDPQAPTPDPPAHRPTPNATVMTRIGGRMLGPPQRTTSAAQASLRSAAPLPPCAAPRAG